MSVKYICAYCGASNSIDNIAVWFFTPHLMARKWLKCKHCDSRRHFMKRSDGRKWIDWPKENNNGNEEN